jgi:translation initiation factor 2 subunit 1
MYEQRYPEVDDLVMVKVKQIAEMGAYVSLLEYNNIEGMILLSELSRRRIRSINKLIRVGRNEVVVVLRVDKEKGYIDLSKRRVSPDDAKKLDDKYSKSKVVHSIMKHLAETNHKRVEDLYSSFAWPLYKTFGHAYDAFKLALSDADKVFGTAGVQTAIFTAEIKAALLEQLARRLTPKAVKVRADIELTCFHYEGIDSIKAALRAGEVTGEPAPGSEDENELKIRLVAPPLYVMFTTTLEKDQGIALLDKALTAIKAKITELKGNLVVKVAPRAVTETDDKELNTLLEDLERQNQEVPGDEPESQSDEE